MTEGTYNHEPAVNVGTVRLAASQRRQRLHYLWTRRNHPTAVAAWEASVEARLEARRQRIASSGRRGA